MLGELIILRAHLPLEKMMNFDKLENIVRFRKLSGLPEVRASEIMNISESTITMTESEFRGLPMWQKTTKLGDAYVMDFENSRFELKPVTLINEAQASSGSPDALNNLFIKYIIPTLLQHPDSADIKNKIEYAYVFYLNSLMRSGVITNDDAKVMKLPDDLLSDPAGYVKRVGTLSEAGIDDFDPGYLGPTYTKEQVYRATKILQHIKSKLELEKGDTQSTEDAEYLELMRKKKAQEEREAVMNRYNNPSLTLESVDWDAYIKEKKVLDLLDAGIKDVKARIGKEDSKGYNDGDGKNSVKNKAIDCMQQVKDNLKRGKEGFFDSQMFFLSLMNPIQNLFPDEVVKFLTNPYGEETNKYCVNGNKTDETEITESIKLVESRKKRLIDREFATDILPHVIKRYGSSPTTVRTAYNDYMDHLHRDGVINDHEVDNWVVPDSMENNPEKWIELNESSSMSDVINTQFVYEKLPKLVSRYSGDDLTNMIRREYSLFVDDMVDMGMLDPREAEYYYPPRDMIANPKGYMSRFNVGDDDDLDSEVSLQGEVWEDSYNYDTTKTVFNEFDKTVTLYGHDDKVILQWSGDTLYEAIDSGELNPLNWHGSAFTEARKRGLVSTKTTLKEHMSSVSKYMKLV